MRRRATRHVCPNCRNAQRKGSACHRCGLPLQRFTLDFSPFAIAMYVSGSLAVISLAMVAALWRGGVLVALPAGFFVLLTFVMMAWDDWWVDVKAKEYATDLWKRAIRCPVCGTALQFGVRGDPGYCARCGTYRPTGLPPPPPP